MAAMSKITTASFVLLALLSVGPIGGCPPSSDDPNGTGITPQDPDPNANLNYELSDGEFILYSHPDDPRILGGLSEDGEGLTVYAEKDINGLPTNLTALRYQTPGELGTDEATWVFFDDSGRLRKMLGVDGSTMEFDWISATRVVISAISGDGSTQVNITKDLPDSSSGKLKAETTAREQAGNDAPISRSPGAKGSAWLTNDSVIIYVDRCGRPVDGAEVSVTFGSPGDTADPSFYPLALPARPTGSPGEYKARLPAHETITDLTDGEICQAIADRLGYGCKFVEVPGGKDLLCTELGATVAMYNPPAGGGTFALCEGTFAALTVYCETLGKGEAGSPTLADAICDRIKQTDNSAFGQGSFSGIALSVAEIQATARLPGVAWGSSAPVRVSSYGPFPELSVTIYGDAAVQQFSTTPADPEPGEDYVATAKLSCLPSGSVVRMSVVRSVAGFIYYSDSTEVTVHDDNPEPVIDLPVPGARVEAVDLVTVEVVGGDLRRDFYVTFDCVTEGAGCDASSGSSGATVYCGEGVMAATSQANFGIQGSETLTQTVHVEVRLFSNGTASGTISGDQVLITTCPTAGSDPGGDTQISEQEFTTSWSGTHEDGSFELHFGELGAEFSITGTYGMCDLSGSGVRSGSFEVPCPSGTLTGQQTLTWTIVNLPRVE